MVSEYLLPVPEVGDDSEQQPGLFGLPMREREAERKEQRYRIVRVVAEQSKACQPEDGHLPSDRVEASPQALVEKNAPGDKRDRS